MEDHPFVVLVMGTTVGACVGLAITGDVADHEIDKLKAQVVELQENDADQIELIELQAKVVKQQADNLSAMIDRCADEDGCLLVERTDGDG